MSHPTWWGCPNEPRCGHAGIFHDIEDLEDQQPRCCVDGCRCGGSAESTESSPPYAQPMSYLDRGDRVGWTDQQGVVHTGVVTDRRDTARGTELDITPDEEGSAP